MTKPPDWHEIFVDEEVHHFLHQTAKSVSVSENEVLRAIIFGEKMGMSADAREQAARAEEAGAQVDIGPHGGTITTVDIDEVD